jgi:hypothetical protein
MVSVRVNLEKLKQAALETLQKQEADLRAAQARLGAFNESATALGPAANDATKAALIRRLQEKIKKEQTEIAALGDSVARARARAEGFDEVLRLVPREGEDELRPGSKMYEVREFLRAAGRPMPLSEILKAIGFEGKEDKKNSLRGSLAAYANKGRVFIKGDAPETFGLIEFHTNTANEETT